MERAWHQANSCEVLSREGQPGTAPMKMLFSGYRASLKTKAAETLAQLATLEDAEKTVEERRTLLYNQVVTSYHRAKIERAALARELEVVKGELYASFDLMSYFLFNLVREGDDAYIDQGWTAFTVAHQLQIGQFLVFKKSSVEL
ncbi:uncharacterized protein LOC124694934 [Lolium rigidum]|uniref:uncharacterized protein LOC124694934 n=1 Tax=Lolium rigidum TaxID=89674 RepID=UPI001F5DE316|nr:uncharacterized protein LOC124694934 [Lolium rigidum]